MTEIDGMVDPRPGHPREDRTEFLSGRAEYNG